MQRVPQVMSNLRHTFSNFSEICGEKVAEFPGVICTRHPSRTADFNQAFLQDESALEPAVLKEVQEFFREIHAGWCFVVPPDLAEHFGRASKRIRISKRTAIPEMVMENGSVPVPPPPHGLKVTQVETVADLRAWARTCTAGFEIKTNEFGPMLNSRSLKRSGSESYIGWVSGKPVATSNSYVSEGVAGIFAVGTIPRARGRGYGEAMTWAALGDGLNKKCEFFSLQASPTGFPIYHRMGFRHVFDIEEWVVPATAPGVTL